MSKTVKACLHDIMAEINRLADFTKEFKDAKVFSTDTRTVYACARSLEIMGEAAKLIPEDSRKKYPQIPWRKLTGMRDRLIHDYGASDVGIIYKTAKDDVPAIKADIEKMIKETAD
ncbi:MAG: DUF86 domain-containing protein [Deltaproteobacteria bacterium]